MRKFDVRTWKRSLLLATALTSLLGISTGALALGEKACKRAVARQFPDAARRDVFVSPSIPKKNGRERVDWSIQTNRTTARGFCRISSEGKVARIKTLYHKRYHKNRNEFYYDEHIGKWRNSNGRVCRKCSREDGFHDHAGWERDYSSRYDKTMKVLERSSSNTTD